MKAEKPIIVNCINPDIEQELADFNNKTPKEQLKEFYDIMTQYMDDSEIAEFDKKFQKLSAEYLKEKT